MTKRKFSDKKVGVVKNAKTLLQVCNVFYKKIKIKTNSYLEVIVLMVKSLWTICFNWKLQIPSLDHKKAPKFL